MVHFGAITNAVHHRWFLRG